MESNNISEITSKALKGTKWIFLSSITSNIFQFLSTIVLARLLAPSDFGLIAYAMIIISIVSLFQDLGLKQALIQRRDNVTDAANTVFITTILLGLFWYTGTYFSAPYIASFFGNQQITSILRITALSFVITPFGFVQGTMLTKELYFKKVSFLNLISSVIPGILSILLAVSGFGIWSLVYGFLAGTVLNVLASWLIVSWKPEVEFNLHIARKLFKFGRAASAESLLSWMVNTFDDLLVGKWLGSSALGIYRVGFNIAVAPAMQISNPLIGIAFPAFSKMQNNIEEMKKVFLKCIKMISLITFPLGAGIAATSALFIPVLFSDKWAPSIPVIQYISIYGIIMSIGSLIPQVYKALGRPDIYLKYVLVRTIITIPVYFYVVPYGIIAVSLSHLLLSLLISPFNFYIMTRILKMKSVELVSVLKTSFIAALSMGIFSLFLVKILSAYFGLSGLVLTITIILSVLFYLTSVRLLDKEAVHQFKILIKEAF
ncbi:MAG: MOP flippase family protein [Nitrospirae bacterium]|nr:MOP flippase family protein [Nitrospirota bacterium]